MDALRKLAGLPAALLLPACGADTGERAPTPAGAASVGAAAAPARRGSEGVAVALPAGWYSTEPDDGHVVDPVTRLVVSSAPIRPEASGCQIDGYGMADDAVTLVVVEWDRPGTALPERPEHFTSRELPVQPPPAIECFDGAGGSARFGDSGRSFGTYLLVGVRARAGLVEQARDVLDTLRVEPSRRLARNGIALAVPAGWDGRILFRDAAGAAGAIFQVANFELPGNEGFEPPSELPPGQEDPIKAMGAGDVLVMVDSGETDGRPAPEAIALGDLHFLPAGAPRVPRGHALADGSFCYGARCLRIEVDFGGGVPPSALGDEVDRVLASLSVE